MRQICLSSIISNATNNKKKLWKTVRLKSFERPIISLLFNFLQLYLSASTSIFAVLFILSFNALIFYFYVSLHVATIRKNIYVTQLYTVPKKLFFSFAETANRLRRQAIPYVGKICDGGMDYDTALRYCDKPDLKCKVATRTCYKWVTCPGGGGSEAPPSSLMAVNSLVVEVPSNGCLERHVYADVSCCKYECP